MAADWVFKVTKMLWLRTMDLSHIVSAKTDSKPLLTIAIPTYQRARFLEELLNNLGPQLKNIPRIELLISDNASMDDTERLIEGFAGRGLEVRYIRNKENIGPDGNFLQCFELATGKFFLLFGDDDLLVPGALLKIIGLLDRHDPDIVYLSSYSFAQDFMKERRGDPLGRSYQILTDPIQFARIANLMLTFISGVIVNRDRLLEIKHEPVASFTGTNLIQLSWTLPLLQVHRSSICVWERLLAGRSNNSGGYNIARVFGVNLKHVSERLLPLQPKIAQAFSNAALRRWFPGSILDLRKKGAGAAELDEIESLLRAEHDGNVRFDIFVYPILHSPLWFARIWVEITQMTNKLIYIAYFPKFWRK